MALLCAGCASSGTRYEELMRSPTVAGCEKFERDHPGSPYFAHVRMVHESLAWKESLLADRPEAYENFERKFPSSPRAGKARRFVEHAALRPDATTWEVAMTVAAIEREKRFAEAVTLEGCRAFCLRYPDPANPAAVEARARWAELSYDALPPTEEAFQLYLWKFPETAGPGWQAGEEALVRAAFGESLPAGPLPTHVPATALVALARALARNEGLLREIRGRRAELAETLASLRELRRQCALLELESREARGEARRFQEFAGRIEESIRATEEADSAFASKEQEIAAELAARRSDVEDIWFAAKWSSK